MDEELEQEPVDGTLYTETSWGEYQEIVDYAKGFVRNLTKEDQKKVDDLVVVLKAKREALVEVDNEPSEPKIK